MSTTTSSAPPSSFLDPISYHIRTLYLFTARDIITCIIPVVCLHTVICSFHLINSTQTAFACVAGPVHSWTSLLHAVFWLWAHLLQCNVSNQYTGAAEDKINKAWRPIPAGRVTIENAWRLRLALPFLCFALSIPYGSQVMWASVGVAASELWYDELNGALHWASKTLCSDVTYSMLEAGTSLIASNSTTLDDTAIKAILCAFAIFASTLHAADFPDVVGDKAQGRVTLPMLFPNASRVGFAITIIAWSVYLAGPSGWGIGPMCSALFIAFGAWVGARVVHLRTEKADKTSYNWYDVSDPRLFVYRIVAHAL